MNFMEAKFLNFFFGGGGGGLGRVCEFKSILSIT